MGPLFLAQLFGLYFLIVGAIVAFRKRSIIPAVAELASNKAVLLVLGAVELAAGLAIVLAYPEVSTDWMGIISLVGWIMVVESILYFALPSRKVRTFIGQFNTPFCYAVGGLASMILGAYLTIIGFQLS